MTGLHISTRKLRGQFRRSRKHNFNNPLGVKASVIGSLARFEFQLCLVGVLTMMMMMNSTMRLLAFLLAVCPVLGSYRIQARYDCPGHDFAECGATNFADISTLGGVLSNCTTDVRLSWSIARRNLREVVASDEQQQRQLSGCDATLCSGSGLCLDANDSDINNCANIAANFVSFLPLPDNVSPVPLLSLNIF